MAVHIEVQKVRKSLLKNFIEGAQEHVRAE